MEGENPRQKFQNLNFVILLEPAPQGHGGASALCAPIANVILFETLPDDDFGEIDFRKNPGPGPPSFASTLDSTACMRLAGHKNRREVVLKHVSEVVGRIKTLWECSMTILGKSIFEDFSTPKNFPGSGNIDPRPNFGVG